MRVPALLVGLLVAAACAGDAEPTAEPAETSGDFRRSTAIIETDPGSVLVKVEVADTPELQARGLMGREELADDAGMVFLFFEEHGGGFWMKNTLIPLSIAFFDADGEILEILDMEPCKEDPCPVYDPGVSYRGALEVNQGSFEDWGVEVGDEINVSS